MGHSTYEDIERQREAELNVDTKAKTVADEMMRLFLGFAEDIKRDFLDKKPYTRMQVLRGEYVPTEGKRCFAINGDRIYPVVGRQLEDSAKSRFDGIVFSPTEELGQEYLHIKTGRWKLQEGDFAYGCRVDEGHFGTDIGTSGDYAYWKQLFNEMAYFRWALFPSEKMLHEFIADHKPQPALPTVEELRAKFGELRKDLGNGDPEWDAKFGSLEIYGKHYGMDKLVFRSWFHASMRSKFYANLIRKAERAMGATKLQRTPAKSLAFMGDNLHACHAGTFMYYGAEYFATQEGLDLYVSAMSDDLKFLLTQE